MMRLACESQTYLHENSRGGHSEAQTELSLAIARVASKFDGAAFDRQRSHLSRAYVRYFNKFRVPAHPGLLALAEETFVDDSSGGRGDGSSDSGLDRAAAAVR